jgi:hypothetical protein
MPLFNFQKQFAADIESREKRQTIRARRKNRPKVGQTAYLYTGARTKACRKLGEGIIKKVEPLIIEHDGIRWLPHQMGELLMRNEDYLNFYATADGFADWPAMRDWFQKTHGLPFEGDLIRW